jgi:hypothetical protein
MIAKIGPAVNKKSYAGLKWQAILAIKLLAFKLVKLEQRL